MTTARRIGIYGGTFDPVHLAHLVLAEQCRDQMRLDEIWFVPAHHPPHKSTVAVTPADHRRQMLEFAIAGHEHFRICSVELDRTGPSFTVDTLETLTSQHPAVEWSLLIGADSLRDFPNWRGPERITQLAHIVVVNRGQDALPDLEPYRQRFGDVWSVVTMPGLDIAASDIRLRTQQGRSIRYLVPRAVEVYIQQHGLYRV
ncbi:nicotinate-nucleotide adenylyltransferase [bacterium]|nr:nicotinate-nucleotide adenylyltransferase [bacterium]